MKNSRRIGLKSIVAIVAIALLAAMMLTGCSDAVSQEAAKEAKNAAAAAQDAADKAATDAANAQKAADQAIADAAANKDAIAALPEDADVADAINKVINVDDAVIKEIATALVDIELKEDEIKASKSGDYKAKLVTLAEAKIKVLKVTETGKAKAIADAALNAVK